MPERETVETVRQRYGDNCYAFTPEHIAPLLAALDGLRAALTTYADPAHWFDLDGAGEEWVWDGDDGAGWALAQAALDALSGPRNAGTTEEGE